MVHDVLNSIHLNGNIFSNSKNDAELEVLVQYKCVILTNYFVLLPITVTLSGSTLENANE